MTVKEFKKYAKKNTDVYKKIKKAPDNMTMCDALGGINVSDSVLVDYMNYNGKRYYLNKTA